MRGLVVALFVSVVAVCPAVAAPESTSISINFAAEAGLFPVTGPAGFLGTSTWNNLPGQEGQIRNLFAGDGDERIPTQIDMDWTFAASIPNNRADAADQNDVALMTGHLEGPGELRLRGLNEQFVHGYDVILYTFGSAPGSIQTYSIETADGNRDTQETQAPIAFTGQYVEGENFITFRNVQSDFLRLNVFSGLNGIEIDGADYNCLAGDFNNDGNIDVDDIDALTGQIKSGKYDECFDLNSDGIVDSEDGETWVNDIKQIPPGDANMDGEFNSSDLITIFAQNEYEDDIECNSGWADGDFNHDGEFDSGDLIAAFSAGYYEKGPINAVAAGEVSAVPEASSSMLLVLGGLVLALRIRRQMA